MSCNSKHNQQEKEEGRQLLAFFRKLFIKRMTIDRVHNDRRRKDFNQAIFDYNDDGSTFAIWSETDMDMVLQCFDDAVKDWRESWCDTKNCTRKDKH